MSHQRLDSLDVRSAIEKVHREATAGAVPCHMLSYSGILDPNLQLFHAGSPCRQRENKLPIIALHFRLSDNLLQHRTKWRDHIAALAAPGSLALFKFQHTRRKIDILVCKAAYIAPSYAGVQAEKESYKGR